MGYRATKSKIKVENNKTNNYTEFYYHFFRNVLIVALPLLIISALILSIPRSSANGVDTLTLTLSSSCTMSSTVDIEHNGSLTSGTYIQNIGQTTITTLCNDGNGYAVYANGYSNNEEGNNKLINTEYPQYSIDTGLATSGLASTWAMKLNNIPDDPSPTPPTIETEYNNTYGLVPSYWTKVASRASGTTDMDEGSSFTTTYSVYASSNQHAGSYLGQVKYLLTHPDNTNKHIYFMQEVDTWKNTLAMEESVQAIDKRDGKSYWVTKLQDGHIWMTQNLDLCIGCTGTAALTSENTDISTTASGGSIYSDGYTQYNEVWTWNPAGTAITSSRIVNYSNNRVANWPDSYTEPYSAEGGDTYFHTSNSDDNDIRYDSLSICTDATHTATECEHYHVGNYYNWAAAVASNNVANFNTQYDNAANSICPKGWRLPIGTNNNNSIREFGNLLVAEGIISSTTSTSYINADGFKNIRKSPLWFVRPGTVATNALYDAASYGRYWSSTVDNTNNSYRFGFDLNVSPANPSYKMYGWPIRCIAR